MFYKPLYNHVNIMSFSLELIYKLSMEVWGRLNHEKSPSKIDPLEIR